MKFTTTIKSFGLIALFVASGSHLRSQTVKEVQQELSKKASKGYVYKIENSDDGELNITYKIPGDKKKNEVFFEKYTFDKDLNFKGSGDVNIAKEEKPDKEETYYSAMVGGCTSFDILSMKLRLNRRVLLTEWSSERQRFVYKKTISNETIKAKNDNGKSYMGVASYLGNNEDGKEIFNLVRVEGEKKDPDKYYILLINSSLELKETPVEISGAKTLVFSAQFENEDIAMVFAPNEDSPDLTLYDYLVYGQDGTLKKKASFKSPASALLISSAFMRDGSVYFCGTSIESKKAFEEEFSEYSPIQNPCYTSANNYRDDKWEKSALSSMDNFHFLRFTDDKLDFSSSTPIKSFKSKFVTAPSDKGAEPYKGKKLNVTQFFVTKEGEFMVAGQLTGRENMGNGNMVKAYYDVVCMHFDKSGNLRAQYGVEKINSDKKSEIFEMPLRFIPSADGATVYWEILEVKGIKGYESFMDAYNGNATFYARYFPRIIAINTKAATIGDSKVLGNEKFFVRGKGQGIWNEQMRTMTYVGHDDDFEKLWAAKLTVK